MVEFTPSMEENAELMTAGCIFSQLIMKNPSRFCRVTLHDSDYFTQLNVTRCLETAMFPSLV